MLRKRTRLLTGATAAGVAVAALTWHAAPAAAQGPIDDLISACGAGDENPYLVTTCFQRGTRFDDEPSVVAFRDTDDNPGHVDLASAGEVGATYGLAFHAPLEVLYIGAFHKRGTHFGPAGPGGVYEMNLRTGEVATFVTVPNAGEDTHDPAGDFFPDISGRFPAGKTSLGDVDLSTDGTELAVVNLNDRRIYRYSVPGGDALGAFDHGAAAAAWSDDARPFGLGYRGDRLYHGVVRSAESSQEPDELWAFVYESAWDGSNMREVASTPLRYERGMYWPNEGNAMWNPWVDPPGSVHRFGRFAMPLLADIVFTGNGSQMILGFRDRFGDETFFTFAPQNPPPGESINNVPAGDILPAFPENDGWRIEVDPEHYDGDYGPNPQGTHDETSFGGLAVIPGSDLVAMSANSPQRINSAGGVWLSIAEGGSQAREQIYAFQENNYGKANGLGDMEVVCDTLAEPTPTPTTPPTEVPTATSTPPPATVTPPATPTPPGPTATLPPGVTPEPDEPDEEATPEPTVLPKLPKTGGGAQRGSAGGARRVVGSGLERDAGGGAQKAQPAPQSASGVPSTGNPATRWGGWLLAAAAAAVACWRLLAAGAAPKP